MPAEVFQLKTLTCVLADKVELAEVLGMTEVSALDDVERKWRSALQAKAKAVLEDETLSPAVSLHRRRAVTDVELDSVEMIFEPPRRSPDWQEAVRLRIHYARWAESDLHHAYAPALGVHVFATRAALLAERVQQHVRLVLAGRSKQLTLLQLAELERVQSLRPGDLEVTVNRKTPKQMAAAGGAVEEPNPRGFRSRGAGPGQGTGRND